MGKGKENYDTQENKHPGLVIQRIVERSFVESELAHLVGRVALETKRRQRPRDCGTNNYESV